MLLQMDHAGQRHAAASALPCGRALASPNAACWIAASEIIQFEDRSDE
jgi:hypothetical protein